MIAKDMCHDLLYNTVSIDKTTVTLISSISYYLKVSRKSRS